MAVATPVRISTLHHFEYKSGQGHLGAEYIPNGLLYQYLPKGTDVSVYTQEQLDQIALSLNTRPSKTLKGMTPLEAFTALIA